MSDQLGQVLVYHLRFYQLIGFHGLPLPGDTQPLRTRRLLRLWTIILLLIFTSVTLWCLTSDDDFLYTGDSLASVNDVLKFFFAELAVVSIYIETLTRHRDLSHFWQLHSSLTLSHGPRLGRFLVCLYGLTLIELLLLGLFCLKQTITHQVLLFWSTFEPFVWMVHLRNKQFVLHLEMLRQQLEQLEQELALLVEYARFASLAASFVGFEDYLRRRLRQKQLIYGSIYEMYTSFQQAFGFSLVTVILMIFMRVTVDCYFMYYTIYYKIENIDCYLMVPAILEIPAFIFASQSCMEMVPRIAYQLHSLVTGSGCCSSRALSVQIQNFSLQILHQPVRIHALGITVLDAYLLTRVACSISTYMIYTVQFMPKFSSQQV